MRIACLIDSLGSGGAERQLCELAVGLQGSGHEVALCHYHGQNSAHAFYETGLRQGGVEIERVSSTDKLDRLRKVRAWLNRLQPDILQSYLSGPNAIAVLTGYGRRHWKVVVSERIQTDYRQAGDFRSKIIARLFCGADWIVANSYSGLESLAAFIPSYQRKSSVIWNCVDLDRFQARQAAKRSDTFRFLCVASMGSRKNSRRLAEALSLLRDQSDRPFELRWAGRYNDRVPDHRENMTETRNLIQRFGLEEKFIFVGEVEDVESEYRNADALVLVSTREGLPNVICEGMASGLPIIAGAVADIPMIVREGENGFLCDPWSVNDIARALGRCLDLSPEERSRLGKTSRLMAEELFGKTGFICQYEALYETLLSKRPRGPILQQRATGE